MLQGLFYSKERKDSAEAISELDGPAIDTSCHYICISCKDKVSHRKIPKFALAKRSMARENTR